MEIFGRIHVNGIKAIGERKGGYRLVVMTYFQELINRFNDQLTVEMRDKVSHIAGTPSEAEKKFALPSEADTDEMKPKPTSERTSLDEQYLTLPSQAKNEEGELAPIRESDVQRAIHSEKRRKRQEMYARKAMKQRGKALVEKGLGPGAVLSLKVDYRTHSHASGLVAIVYKSNETGGALICCEHGVITHNGSKKDFFVPSDKYNIVADRDAPATIPPPLAEVRERVKAGEYDYVNAPRISYAKLHGITIGSSGSCERNICSCKSDCKNRCGCRKRGLTCSSACGCSGNCTPEEN